MLFFLRNIRRKLISNNKVATYLLYAIGEILLVVIGILIAVSIDNWNEDRKERIKEIHYLTNIKSDLQKDLISLKELIDFRVEKQKACAIILEKMESTLFDNIDTITYHVVVALGERKFKPNNTTFSELSNSGNLNLITNDSIKTLLLELTNHYSRNTELIEHETFDYQEYISKPTIGKTDLKRLYPIALKQKTAKEMNVNKDDFDALLKDLNYKNGLLIISMMSDAFLNNYQTIEAKSMKISLIIDKELEK